MAGRFRFFLNRLGERLWIKPLAMCLLSVAAAFLARLADLLPVRRFVPEIAFESIETLLTTLSTSMLVIATLAVTSMVSAYASASTTATPRSFPLIIADDRTQNALSTFVGAFIYGVVTLVAVQNSYYDKAGKFAVFSLTVVVFAVVVVTFVRWVDCIARLGRMGNTIKKVEQATLKALEHRRLNPTLGGVAIQQDKDKGRALYGDCVGYVQLIDMAALQAAAEKHQVTITVEALPGSFVMPGRGIACWLADDRGQLVAEGDQQQLLDKVTKAFVIDKERTFDEDPRFGLVSLSQIASRALSPAVNDPGTAIDIIATLVRLLTCWSMPVEEQQSATPRYDRVAVPELLARDLFDDAFGALARDGAGLVEVAVRLQKSFAALSQLGGPAVMEAAGHHAALALIRAEQALVIKEDIQRVREAAQTSLHPRQS